MSCFTPLLLLLLESVFALALAVSKCTIRPVVFNFGDSNSDTGGVRIVMPENFMDKDGRIRKGGRVCDGRLILDFLCDDVEMKSVNPYLQSGSNFGNGANFALAGSIANPQSFSPFNLRTQVYQYIDLYDHCLHEGESSKVGLGEDEFRKALYMLDIGQNDLAIWLANSTYDKVVQEIESSITSIRHAIESIYEGGGRKLWIHNTGPLGCLPGLPRTNESDVDEHGCIASSNRAATEFNSKLNALCEELRLKLHKSTIVYVDIYTIKLQLLLNYTSYGFEQKCCGNIDPHPGHKYVSWDGIHYTEAANSIAASMILSTNFSSPRLPFCFFCLD